MVEIWCFHCRLLSCCRSIVFWHRVDLQVDALSFSVLSLRPLKMEIAGFSETSVSICKSTRSQNPILPKQHDVNGVCTRPTPWTRILLQKIIVCSTSQEIPRVLWHPEVHYLVHKRPTVASVLSEISVVHKLQPSSSKRLQDQKYGKVNGRYMASKRSREVRNRNKIMKTHETQQSTKNGD
jgi:hypothetical protein